MPNARSFGFFFLLLGSSSWAQTEETPPLTLASSQGAAITFTENGGTWRWSHLVTPERAEGWALQDGDVPLVAGAVEDVMSARAWSFVEGDANKLVFQQDLAATELQVRRTFSFGPATNVVRMETRIRSSGASRVLSRAGLLELQVLNESFHETGAAPVSFPLFGKTLFVGLEHVSGHCHADNDRVQFWQTPYLNINDEWQFVAAVVIGWPTSSNCSLFQGDARVRASFLHYLDSVRIKPERMELHTNTWWSLPLPFKEQDVLEHIEALRKGFTERTGMFFDSFALDLGWSNPRTIWEIDGGRFPNGFHTINQRLGEVGSRLGLWISPGSGYPEGLDNVWLAERGYETIPVDNPEPRFSQVACFALGGRYQREFKESIVAHAKTYGLRHVKLDYLMHTCDVPGHGHALGADSFHAIDAGLADVLDALRAVNPNMVLEPLCTGYPPSPWWLAKTPYVLGPYGDDVPYGRVPSTDWMESLISARDIAYRQDQERWIMPTQALETIDIVVQSPGEFENLAVMAVGRGRSFISTYLKPDLMQPTDWDFLAALMRWARENKSDLVNAHMIGGKPENRDGYGYMFHNPNRDIYCVRNPWMQPRTIRLPMCTAIQDVRDLRVIYPRRTTLARIEPGTGDFEITLAPYETLMLETVPADETRAVAIVPSMRAAELEMAGLPQMSAPVLGDAEMPVSRQYSWRGTINLPAINNAELCILVEGSTEALKASGVIYVGGHSAKVTRMSSAGQFGAAGAPSPERWTWLTAPLSPGRQTVQLVFDLPPEDLSVAIYVRGAIPVENESEPEAGAVFPAYRPTQRNWSQTLVPAEFYPLEETPLTDTSAATRVL